MGICVGKYLLVTGRLQWKRNCQNGNVPVEMHLIYYYCAIKDPQPLEKKKTY